MRSMTICTYVLIAALTTPWAAADGERADTDAQDKAARAAITALDKAAKKKDADALGDAVTEIASLYEDIVDKKLRDKLRKAIGKALKRGSHEVKVIAFDAFTRMEDPLAWKYMASYLKQPNAKKEPAYYRETLRAVEVLTPDEAIKPLLTIIRKSKNLGVAARAMKTFAAFKKSKQRTKILEALISTVKKEKPGVKGRENPMLYGALGTGAQARTRWEALVGPLVEAANGMTGQELTSAVSWFEFFQANKRKPEVLFANG